MEKEAGGTKSAYKFVSRRDTNFAMTNKNKQRKTTVYKTRNREIKISFLYICMQEVNGH